MSEFARLFRTARIASGKTYREISKAVGKSIGYLSDIDSGRKNPPERSVVLKIEKALGVTHLARIANKVRMTRFKIELDEEMKGEKK